MKLPIVLAATVAVGLPMLSLGSSHREAPNIAGSPRVDGTDLYLFRSYEPSRENFVTVIANYIPFQNPGGGPNFYQFDPNAIYAVNIDNNGDGKAEISFQFQFRNALKGLAVPANGPSVAVPLLNIGPVTKAGANLNVEESYTITVVRNGKQSAGQLAGNGTSAVTEFYKPTDNIGQKSIADYASYASDFMFDLIIPGCPTRGRVFVGQRKEGFVVNLGEIFDLVNTNPVGPRDGEPNSLSNMNVTSIAMELPIACIVSGKDPVIAAWTTASVPKSTPNTDSTDVAASPSASPVSTDNEGDWQTATGQWMKQVSRLGNPLVNEVIIGLPDKDRFNGSIPTNDAQFLRYVTNPTLPVLLHVLFGNAALVPQSPRNDLVAAFLTGVKGVNQPLNVTPAELMRLNTSIAPTPAAAQNDLGVLGGDNAGFPNGRRPYDDVTDIELRVARAPFAARSATAGPRSRTPIMARRIPMEPALRGRMPLQ